MRSDTCRSTATHGLPPKAAQGAQSSIAFVKNAASTLTQYGPKGQHLQAAAQQAFVDAAHTALIIATVALLAGATFALIRAPRKHESPIKAANKHAGEMTAAAPTPR